MPDTLTAAPKERPGSFPQLLSSWWGVGGGLQTPDPLPRGGPAAWKGLEVPLGLQEGSVSFWNALRAVRSQETREKMKYDGQATLRAYLGSLDKQASWEVPGPVVWALCSHRRWHGF